MAKGITDDKAQSDNPGALSTESAAVDNLRVQEEEALRAVEAAINVLVFKAEQNYVDAVNTGNQALMSEALNAKNIAIQARADIHRGGMPLGAARDQLTAAQQRVNSSVATVHQSKTFNTVAAILEMESQAIDSVELTKAEMQRVLVLSSHIDEASMESYFRATLPPNTPPEVATILVADQKRFAQTPEGAGIIALHNAAPPEMLQVASARTVKAEKQLTAAVQVTPKTPDEVRLKDAQEDALVLGTATDPVVQETVAPGNTQPAAERAGRIEGANHRRGERMKEMMPALIESLPPALRRRAEEMGPEGLFRRGRDVMHSPERRQQAEAVLTAVSKGQPLESFGEDRIHDAIAYRAFNVTRSYAMTETVARTAISLNIHLQEGKNRGWEFGKAVAENAEAIFNQMRHDPKFDRMGDAELLKRISDTIVTAERNNIDYGQLTKIDNAVEAKLFTDGNGNRPTHNRLLSNSVAMGANALAQGDIKKADAAAVLTGEIVADDVSHLHIGKHYIRSEVATGIGHVVTGALHAGAQTAHTVHAVAGSIRSRVASVVNIFHHTEKPKEPTQEAKFDAGLGRLLTKADEAGFSKMVDAHGHHIFNTGADKNAQDVHLSLQELKAVLAKYGITTLEQIDGQANGKHNAFIEGSELATVMRNIAVKEGVKRG